MMLAALATLFASACCSSLPQLAAKDVAFPAAAPLYERVAESREVWRDEERRRDVPVKIYAPEGATGRLPVVVFSHGIGEDREAYAYLGRALARHGFLAVHATHKGTDREALQRGYLRFFRRIQTRDKWVNRPLDVSFVLDRLAAREDADVHRAGVVGHSAGAFTAFAAGGLRAPAGEEFRDPRVKAGVAMSMPRMGRMTRRRAFDSIDIPILNITGTCDAALLHLTLPHHRRKPFEAADAPRQYLATIEGVDHDSFVHEDARQDVIAALTVAFLRAWLTGDEKARRWFDDAGTGEVIDTTVALERKTGVGE